jgi:hypothetical protein
MSTTEQVPATGDSWMYLMRRGQFEAAWELSDQVLEERRGQPCGHWPRHFQYIWDGSPVAGRRVFVRCYHGLGDTLQFIRYASLLKQIGAHVIVWAQPVLRPLLETVRGVDELLPLHDGVPESDYDVDVELMELPHVFRTTLDRIPNKVPYVSVQRIQQDDSASLKVGVVWRSGGWDERRSMSASLMAQLDGVRGVELQVLQNRADADEWPRHVGKRVCPEPVTELARAISGLDLLITIDSLAAHLGGALAVPTWTLLPTHADWRWMENRSDSPWYPTMRLWRQSRAGDWHGVIDRVRTELMGWAESRYRRCDSNLSARL